MNYQPAGWASRVLGAVLLLVGIAIGARVVYGLLAPLVPVLTGLVVLGVVYVLALQRRR